MNVAAVVGNPNPAGRTLEAAMLLASKIDADAEPVVVDSLSSDRVCSDGETTRQRR